MALSPEEIEIANLLTEAELRRLTAKTLEDWTEIMVLTARALDLRIKIVNRALRTWVA
jgi:hypothetical protein